jgi:hypothetical protein
MMRAVHNRLGDPNSGNGYGTLKPKSSGVDYATQETYPYHEKREPILDISDEDEDLADQILRKIDMSTVAKGPTTGRTDRSTFTKNRLDLSENADVDIMNGIVPFPFSKIYGKFGGPSVGGFSTMKAYTTRPGKNLKSTTRGWSQVQNFDPIGDEIRIENIHDMIDPSIRSIAKNNLMIKLAQEDSE